MAIYFILWVITQYYHFIYFVVQVVLALALSVGSPVSLTCPILLFS